MFILATTPTWTWPVVVLQPAEDGSFAEHRFRATWQLLPAEEREQLGKTAEGTSELLRRSLVAVLDLADEQKSPLASSPALVEACIANPWIRAGLVRSFVQAIDGVPLARAAEGN